MKLCRLFDMNKNIFVTLQNKTCINMVSLSVILGIIGTQEIIIIALVILLFFGGRKIPELMKGLGKGVKQFKDGVKGVEDEEPKKEAK